MKSMNLNLTVQNVRKFTNAEGRQYINLITIESFPKRKADENTGEYVETTTNELVMPLKQFMHIIYLTPNFLQVFFAKCDRQYYSTMSDGEWYSLLLGSTISVTIERYEDGDVFINEISGEEDVSDGVSYHTRLTKVTLAICGRKYALHFADDEDAVEATILELQSAKVETFKFPVDKTEKAAE